MANNSDARLEEPSVARDRGFGLVEVIVAMALLLIVAISMLPVFINTLNLSKENVSVTTATQLVSEQMDQARSISPSCLAVNTFRDETLGRTVPDPRGVVLIVTMSTDAACPTSYPTTYRLTVTVKEQGGNVILAEAETQIMITRAGQ